MSELLENYVRVTRINKNSVFRLAFQEYKEKHKLVDLSYMSSGMQKDLEFYGETEEI